MKDFALLCGALLFLADCGSSRHGDEENDGGPLTDGENMDARAIACGLGMVMMMGCGDDRDSGSALDSGADSALSDAGRQDGSSSNDGATSGGFYPAGEIGPYIEAGNWSVTQTSGSCTLVSGELTSEGALLKDAADMEALCSYGAGADPTQLSVQCAYTTFTFNCQFDVQSSTSMTGHCTSTSGCTQDVTFTHD